MLDMQFIKGDAGVFDLFVGQHGGDFQKGCDSVGRAGLAALTWHACLWRLVADVPQRRQIRLESGPMVGAPTVKNNRNAAIADIAPGGTLGRVF